MNAAWRPRAGFSLVEVLVGLVLGSAVILAITSAVTVHARAVARVAETVETLEAYNLATAVLDAELRDVRTSDRSVTADSIGLRAFRGRALVCDTVGGRAHIRFDGSRAPDPGKDSVLFVGVKDEAAYAFDTPSDVAISCPVTHGVRGLAVRVDGPVRPGDALLFFERGSYHLSDRAFRWRVGAAGRQPLTAEVLGSVSRFLPGAPPGIHLQAHARLRGRPLTIPLRTREGS